MSQISEMMSQTTKLLASFDDNRQISIISVIKVKKLQFSARYVIIYYLKGYGFDHFRIRKELNFVKNYVPNVKIEKFGTVFVL